MNILYVISKKHWGGVNKWVIETAQGLNELGHTTWIFINKNSEMKKNIPTYLNYKCLNFGMDFNPKIIHYIFRFIKKNNIDLVVTNKDKDISIGGVASYLAKVPNIRRIGSFYDINSRIKTRFLQNRFVSYSIVPCQEIKNLFSFHYHWMNLHKMEVIYNSVDINGLANNMTKDELRKKYGIPIHSFVLGITSRLAKEKQIDKLISYVKPLFDIYKDFYLVIAGTGPEESKIVQIINHFKINKRVIMLGFVKNPLEIAKSYDVGCLVSKYEGFPNSILEYMAVGIPVISTDVGGVKEILQHGINGFLIKDGDEVTFRKYLGIFINNKEILHKMGEAAYNQVINNFTKEKQIIKLETFFKNILSKWY